MTCDSDTRFAVPAEVAQSCCISPQYRDWVANKPQHQHPTVCVILASLNSCVAPQPDRPCHLRRKITADKTPLVAAVQTELAITRKSGLPVYPYVYLRSYTCSHAPEFIKVLKSANQEEVIQTVLRPDQVEKEIQVHRVLKYRLGWCLSCAVRLREHSKSC